MGFETTLARNKIYCGVECGIAAKQKPAYPVEFRPVRRTVGNGGLLSRKYEVLVEEKVNEGKTYAEYRRISLEKITEKRKALVARLKAEKAKRDKKRGCTLMEVLPEMTINL